MQETPRRSTSAQEVHPSQDYQEVEHLHQSPQDLQERWRQVTDDLAIAAQQNRYGATRAWLTTPTEWPTQDGYSRYLYASYVDFPATHSEILELRWKNEHYLDIIDALEAHPSPDIGILKGIIEASAYRDYHPCQPSNTYIHLGFSKDPSVTSSRSLMQGGQAIRHRIPFGLPRHTLAISHNLQKHEWVPEEDAFAPEFPDELSKARIPTADFFGIAQAIASLIRTPITSE